MATSFNANPTVTDGSFRVDSNGPAVPLGTSGSTDVIALGPTDIPKIPVFMTAPAGYQFTAAQDQVTLEQAPGASQPSQSSIIFAHFVSGPNLIDLEEGALSSPPSGAISVTLANGRTAKLTIDLVSSYLDIQVDNQPIRLEGPSLDALMKAAVLVKAQPSSS